MDHQLTGPRRRSVQQTTTQAQAQQNQRQRPVDFFDNLRKASWSSSGTSGGGGGDGVQVETSANSNLVKVNDTYILAHLVSIMPTTVTVGPPDDPESRILLSPIWLEVQVGYYLAMLDFNDRRSSIVQDLQQRLQDCPVYLTMEFRDNQFSPTKAGSELYHVAAKRKYDNIRNHGGRNDANGTGTGTAPIPAAVLGPVRSVSSEVVAILGGSLSTPIPSISGLSTSRSLENVEQYPYFSRSVPSDLGVSITLCMYLKSIGVTHLNVLYVNDSFGKEYWVYIQQSAKQYGITVFGASYDDTDTSFQSLDNAIEVLQKTQVKYFMGVLAPEAAPKFVHLYKRNMIGPNSQGNVWFHSTGPTRPEHPLNLDDEYDLALAHAANGTMVLGLVANQTQANKLHEAISTFPHQGDRYEHFVSSFTEPELQQLLRDKFNYEFLDPSNLSLLCYDAVMALGFSMCQGVKEAAAEEEEEEDGQGPLLSGPKIHEGIKQVEFVGASGQVSFNATTGSRNFEDLPYHIFNIVTTPISDDTEERGEGKPGNFATWTEHYNSIVMDIAGDKVIQNRPLLFPDGSTSPPPMLSPLLENLHLVKRPTLLFAWTAASITMATSLALLVWTVRNRRTRVVKASQPIFLAVLCCGTCVMAFAIIPWSFQEDMLSNDKWLDIGCMLVPWSLALGFAAAFAALFSKTWRVLRVFESAHSFRRVSIRPVDVMWPLVTLMSIDITILTIWTIVSPLRWHRVPIARDVFGRVSDSYGTCYDPDSTTELIPLIFLLIINFGALLVTNYQGFKARGLPSEYKESSFVITTNIILLEAFLLAFPIVFMVKDDANARLTVNTVLVLIVSWAVLMPVLGQLFRKPKAVPQFKIHNGDQYQSNRPSEGSDTSRPQGLAVIRYPD